MYLIPRNISNRFEFFPGWGWIELIMLALGIGVGLTCAFLIGLATNSIARYLPILVFGGLGFLASKPIMPDGSTAVQIINYMQRHNRSQKIYLYQKGGF